MDGGNRERVLGLNKPGVIKMSVLPVLQSFNVLTWSKMKIWKFAAIASMLFSSMLSILVCRDLFGRSQKFSFPSSSRSSRTSLSPSLSAGPRRHPRALERRNSLISQCKHHRFFSLTADGKCVCWIISINMY